MSPKDNPDQLCAKLAEYGLTTTLTQDVQTAFEYLKSHISSFLLIDFGIEGTDAFIGKVLDAFYDPPPYILAADYFPCSMSQADILNLGADRCLEKPLDIEEVLATINAVLRRSERLANRKPLRTTPHIERDGLFIDPLRRYVSIDGKSVSLTVKEFDILYLLARNPETVFSKEQIYELVWNEDFRFSTTSVSDHISSLRKKLGLDAKDSRFIHTIYGAGYRLTTPK